MRADTSDLFQRKINCNINI